MGKNDNVTKLFFSNQENFVSVINFYYGWSINAESVGERSERLFTTVESIDNLKCKKQTKSKVLEVNRDVVKRVKVGGQPVIIGIENQQYKDCSEPIRVMLYDSLEYEKQRRIIQFIHRQRNDLNAEDYISGFSKEDFVIPVHTLVIYYGREPWEKPKTVSDIWKKTFDLPQKIQDYRIDVLDVRRLTDEQINRIESEVRLLFGCVKYDTDPVKMSWFVEKNKLYFQRMTREAFLVIATMTESGILQEKMEEWKEKGGKYNMCKAFEEWKKEAERIGLEKGMQQGIQQGMQQGMQQGICAIIKSCKDLGATREKIMELLKDNLSLEESECQSYMEMYW